MEGRDVEDFVILFEQFGLIVMSWNGLIFVHDNPTPQNPQHPYPPPTPPSPKVFDAPTVGVSKILSVCLQLVAGIKKAAIRRP